MQVVSKIIMCVTVLASAGVVAWELQPLLAAPLLAAPRAAPRPAATVSDEPSPAPAPEVDEDATPTVVELPPVVIVGSPPPRSPAGDAGPPAAGLFAEGRCSAWRPLEMGSGEVRVCE